DFGIVFQSYALFPNLTVQENIAVGLKNQGMSTKEALEKVEQWLETIGLPTSGQKFPNQLSGGQQQRVALARALALSPGLLLLDEPLSA
ncbi:ATP-binding cassette domain-containing protein, partial [Escherichia coli]|nr:ATP-binding cassette domain-containing protein [Escherichia coli]